MWQVQNKGGLCTALLCSDNRLCPSIFHLTISVQLESILLTFFLMLFETAEMCIKKQLKFRLTSPKGENYFKWWQEMEVKVVLHVCGL